MSINYKPLLKQVRKKNMSADDKGSIRLASMGKSSAVGSRFVDENDDKKLGGIMGRRNIIPEDVSKEDFMSQAYRMVVASNKSLAEAMAEEDKVSDMKSTKDVGNIDSDFEEQLNQSESSGNTTADRTNKDGKRFAGAAQFGEDRLDEARKALAIDFTMDEFKNSPKLQKRVYGWHIKDIDKAINKLGEKGNRYDKNGLRAVAHLGGIKGMNQYVESGGQYNPKDELGTYLSDYYAKFSSVKGNRNV